MNRVAKLIMVTKANNNKYYDMKEEGGTIHVNYGRVGQGRGQTASYPSSKWESLIKSKVKKGYKDVTELRCEVASLDFATISNDDISAIVTELQALANRSIKANYTVSSESVTQAQVDEAQKILDGMLVISSTKKINIEKFNDTLLDLFQVIPRKMRQVNNHLVTLDANHDDLNKVISNEQATLDVMKGQVRVNTVKKENKADDKRNILQAMGLEISLCTASDVSLIKKELGEISDKFKRAFRITNIRTQQAFDSYVSSRDNKTTKLFWHGSRNENWWSILDTGLVLRPTNAVITGKMFGYGLYFADKARKSYGYTSCRGSYWARGSSSKGFMSLYDVHIGRTLTTKRREYWMGSLNKEGLKAKGDYDSLTAIGGVDLINNEFIVYDQDQCTVKYLVEVA